MFKQQTMSIHKSPAPRHPLATVFFLGSLFLSVALVGCSDSGTSESHGPQMPPAMVSVMTVAPQTVPFVIELPATLSGSKEVEIRARVSGILESRNFEEGDKIQAGQSLFTLELKPFELEVARQQAEYDAAEARWHQAQREELRLKSLRLEKTVSQRDYDDAVSTLQITQADLQSAQTRLEQAKINLQYAKVVSPVSGIVGREQVSEGTYVSGPEMLLTQMTQLDPIRVRFGLAERLQLQMRQDAAKGLLTLPEQGHWRTRLQLQDGSFYQETGTVNFSDVRVNTNTGTSEFQAIIANPDYQLRPGQFVRVLLEGAKRENAFVVPQRAVLDNGTGKYVYLMVKNDQGQSIASPAPIEVGEWVKQDKNTTLENAWVVRRGLKAGDQVIVDGLAKIFFPGAPVSLTPANQSEPPAQGGQSANGTDQH